MLAQSPARNETVTATSGFILNNHRLLGTIGLLTSPGMLLSFAANGFTQDGSSPLSGAFGLLFTFGWFGNVLGLGSLGATGRRLPGKLLPGVELGGIVLAMLFQLFTIFAPHSQSPLYTITDIAWPLSMLGMLIIGIVVAIRGGLRGAARFLSIVCFLWLPLGIVLMNAVSVPVGQIYGGLHIMLGWALLGLAIRNGSFGKRG